MMMIMFDKKLLKMDFFKLHPTYIPFIGDKYSQYKILQIGESHYIGQTPDDEKYNLHYFEKWWNDECKELEDDYIAWFNTRDVITGNFFQGKNRSYPIFYNMIKSFSKVVLDREINSFQDSDRELYHYFSFMNFFQMPSLYHAKGFWKSIDIAAKKINDLELCSKIWNEAIIKSTQVVNDVIDVIQPELVIFTSKLAGDAYKHIMGDKTARCKIIFTCHPGSPWWYKSGRKTLEDEFVNFKK